MFRNEVYSYVNATMVRTYWAIGKIIVEYQGGNETAKYGDETLKQVSKMLTEEYGKGYDTSNLRYMRKFYLTFQNCDALSHNLTWTHYRFLMRIPKKEVRDFYIKECIENHWSTRQLERQINSFYYERLLSSQDKDAVREEIKKLEPSPTAKDIIKDPFVLEFLDLKENKKYLEKEIEQKVIDNLQEFLLELGKGFSFVGRRKRIIGIILCSKKSDAIVRYSVLDDNRNLFASRYVLYLPTEEELKAVITKSSL